ncbi:hypothetical protein SNEBB_006174 [Seison nebaliae]|nr:hypothetical protein SNEBB_006174 [Seison nebaliae]
MNIYEIGMIKENAIIEHINNIFEEKTENMLFNHPLTTNADRFSKEGEIGLRRLVQNYIKKLSKDFQQFCSERSRKCLENALCIICLFNDEWTKLMNILLRVSSIFQFDFSFPSITYNGRTITNDQPHSLFCANIFDLIIGDFYSPLIQSLTEVKKKRFLDREFLHLSIKTINRLLMLKTVKEKGFIDLMISQTIEDYSDLRRNDKIDSVYKQLKKSFNWDSCTELFERLQEIYEVENFFLKNLRSFTQTSGMESFYLFDHIKYLDEQFILSEFDFFQFNIFTTMFMKLCDGSYEDNRQFFKNLRNIDENRYAIQHHRGRNILMIDFRSIEMIEKDDENHLKSINFVFQLLFRLDGMKFLQYFFEVVEFILHSFTIHIMFLCDEKVESLKGMNKEIEMIHQYIVTMPIEFMKCWLKFKHYLIHFSESLFEESSLNLAHKLSYSLQKRLFSNLPKTINEILHYYLNQIVKHKRNHFKIIKRPEENYRRIIKKNMSIGIPEFLFKPDLYENGLHEIYDHYFNEIPMRYFVITEFHYYFNDFLHQFILQQQMEDNQSTGGNLKEFEEKMRNYVNILHNYSMIHENSLFRTYRLRMTSRLIFCFTFDLGNVIALEKMVLKELQSIFGTNNVSILLSLVADLKRTIKLNKSYNDVNRFEMTKLRRGKKRNRFNSMIDQISRLANLENETESKKFKSTNNVTIEKSLCPVPFNRNRTTSVSESEVVEKEIGMDFIKIHENATRSPKVTVYLLNLYFWPSLSYNRIKRDDELILPGNMDVYKTLFKKFLKSSDRSNNSKKIYWDHPTDELELICHQTNGHQSIIYTNIHQTIILLMFDKNYTNRRHDMEAKVNNGWIDIEEICKYFKYTKEDVERILQSFVTSDENSKNFLMIRKENRVRLNGNFQNDGDLNLYKKLLLRSHVEMAYTFGELDKQNDDFSKLERETNDNQPYISDNERNRVMASWNDDGNPSNIKRQISNQNSGSKLEKMEQQWIREKLKLHIIQFLKKKQLATFVEMKQYLMDEVSLSDNFSTDRTLLNLLTYLEHMEFICTINNNATINPKIETTVDVEMTKKEEEMEQPAIMGGVEEVERRSRSRSRSTISSYSDGCRGCDESIESSVQSLGMVNKESDEDDDEDDDDDEEHEEEEDVDDKDEDDTKDDDNGELTNLLGRNDDDYEYVIQLKRNINEIIYKYIP